MASDERAPLTFACPACGAEATLDVVIAHDESARLMAWVIERNAPLGGLVMRYLRLFKPAKQRLRATRVRTLLEGLLADMRRGAITRKGRDWTVSIEGWQAGIEGVLENHSKGLIDLPLGDHAYLYEVLLRVADKAEAEAEQRREAERRGRAHEDGMRSVRETIADMDWAADRGQSPGGALAAAPVGPMKRSRHVLKARAEIAGREAMRADIIRLQTAGAARASGEPPTEGNA